MLKTKANGSIERDKARVVAKGYNQIPRIDYVDSFSLVAKSITVRIFLAVALALQWHIHQLDINNEFLHGHLDEEIYMQPPEGYQVPPGQVTDLEDLCMVSSRPRGSGTKNLQTNFKLMPLYNPDMTIASSLRIQQTRYLTCMQQLSQFLQSPCQQQWDAAMHLVKYLKGTPYKGLFFPTDNTLSLKAYYDADWATCVDSRRSLTSFCIFFGSTLISWKTKKQSMVSRSTAEVEYNSMGTTACELTWIFNLLKDLQVHVPTPIPFLCDNQVALHITTNHVFHERTKHLKIDCHLVHDKYKSSLGTFTHSF
ncbi:UNVERIFIED_CONTAM: Retrovirus-related Pol polyprotein from transposon RE2 [Sesamum latifolium]|uniref:Retrovirus-related Pol polyprotein from transposon RE2 n=1 Tax=Sesamum latifolium TaxID=2727402 RepID=A0AAW2WGA7_9LAMI